MPSIFSRIKRKDLSRSTTTSASTPSGTGSSGSTLQSVSDASTGETTPAESPIAESKESLTSEEEAEVSKQAEEAVEEANDFLRTHNVRSDNPYGTYGDDATQAHGLTAANLTSNIAALLTPIQHVPYLGGIFSVLVQGLNLHAKSLDNIGTVKVNFSSIQMLDRLLVSRDYTMSANHKEDIKTLRIQLEIAAKIFYAAGMPEGTRSSPLHLAVASLTAAGKAVLIRNAVGRVSRAINSFNALCANDIRSRVEDLYVLGFNTGGNVEDIKKNLAPGSPLFVMLQALQDANEQHTLQLKDLSDQLAGLTIQMSDQPLPTDEVEVETEASPVNRDPNFLGRADQLRACVVAVCQTPVQAVAIRGMGGQGKTTLARQLVNEPKVVDHFLERRYWITCENLASTRALRQRVAAAFRWPEADSCAIAERFALACRGGLQKLTLLVLDNLETLLSLQDGEQDEKNALPMNELLTHLLGIENLALVVTMRGQMVPLKSKRWLKNDPLEGLSMAEARQLFIDLADPKLNSEVAEAESAALDELLGAVYGHPLSITLLASRLNERPIRALLKDFRKMSTATLALQTRNPTIKLSRDQSVEVSLAMSFDDSRLSADARMLLRMLGHLSDPLPREQACLLSGRPDAEAEDDVVVLLQLSLLSLVEMRMFDEHVQVLQIHPLVRKMITERMELPESAWKASWPSFVDRAWLDVRENLAIFDYNAFDIAVILFNIAEEAMSVTEQKGLVDRLLREEARMSEYATHVQRQQAMAAMLTNRVNPMFTLQPIGAALQSVRLLKLLNSRDPSNIQCMSMLANRLGICSDMLADQGRHVEALEPSLQSASTYRALFLSTQLDFRPEFVSRQSSLADRCWRLGRHEEAARYSQDAEALAYLLLEESSLEHGLLVGRIMRIRATCLSAVHQKELAINALKVSVRCLEAVCKARPGDREPHHELGASLSHLAINLKDLNRQGEAHQAIGESIKHLRMSLQRSTDPDVDVAIALHTQSDILTQMGKPVDAAKCIKESLAISRDLCKKEPAKFRDWLALVLFETALLHETNDRQPDAIKIIQEAIYHYTVLHDADSGTHYTVLYEADPAAKIRVNLGQSWFKLSTWLRSTDRRGECLMACQKAVDLYREMDNAKPGSQTLQLAVCYYNLAMESGGQSQLTAAADAASASAALYQRLYEEEPASYLEDLFDSLKLLFQCLYNSGKIDDALDIQSRALALLEE